MFDLFKQLFQSESPITVAILRRQAEMGMAYDRRVFLCRIINKNQELYLSYIHINTCDSINAEEINISVGGCLKYNHGTSPIYIFSLLSCKL